MSLFTSSREKWLWVKATVVVVIIYSTLGLMRWVVLLLRQHNLLRVTVGVTMVALAALIAWRLVRRGAGWRELVVAGWAGLVYYAVLRSIHHPEERTHLIEYGVVAAFIYWALVERRDNGRPLVLPPAVLAIVLTAGLGWIDEGIQYLLESRHYDLRDVGFNALAGLMAVGSILLIERVRRARER